MKTRISALGLLVAIMSVTAMGAGFLGTPTAELEKGQWSAGYSFMYSDMDLDTTTMSEKWYEYEDGWGEDSGTDSYKMKIKDFKVQRHYATISYGVEEWWEVFFQLGGASVKARTTSTDGEDVWTDSLNFDNDFAWGWGTRVTFLEQENIRWGASVQMNWLNTSWDDNGSLYEDYGYGYDYSETWKESVDIQTYDLLIAVGPTVDMGGWKLYGGPFFYYLSGDITSKGSGDWSEDGGYYSGRYAWQDNADLETSNFGGFIGAQFDLCENTSLTTELSMTDDGWAMSAGIVWKF